MTNTTITGSAQLVVKSLDTTDARITGAVATGMARGLLVAVGVAQRKYLSGPRPSVLGVRTGRLRNAVAAEVQIDRTVIALERARGGGIREITAGSGHVIGRVGDNVTYAAFHEFGFKGLVNVKAHSRIVSQLDVGGNKIDARRKLHDNKGNFIGYRESRGAADARTGGRAAFVFTQNVRAHPRAMNYKGRPFIRPAVQESLGTIGREISKELKGVANG